MRKYFLKKQVLILVFLLVVQNLFPQTFTEQKGISLPDYLVASVSWGDYDNDSDPDILLSGNSFDSGLKTIIYRNDSGVFSIINAGLAGVNGQSSWGDYDNDGDLDIVLTGNSGSGIISKIYRNDAGDFKDINAGLAEVMGGVSWGDYDNDGDLDILLTGFTVSGEISKIYRNDNGIFTDIKAGLKEIAFGSCSWGDYDNDGDLDILLSGAWITKIYRNDNGVFTDINAALANVVYGSISWGDYDNDGDLDILLTGSTISHNYISKIYRNDAGVFIDINAGLTGVEYSSGAWGDCDNDGDLDILLTGFADTTKYISKIYRNEAGVFTDISAGLKEVCNSAVAWGDYDKDGDLDILLTGYTGSGYISKIYRNNISTTNTIPASPSNLQSNVTGAGITLSWNKANDAQTAQNGLSYNIYIGDAPGKVNKRSPMAALPNGYRKIVSAGVIQGSSWTIKKLPAGRYYWSVQAIDNCFAGSAFATGDSFSVAFSCSIGPYSEQNLTINSEGSVLTVTESGTPASRLWKYSTVSGGPYTHTIQGATGTTYTPNFSTWGTYFIVCESKKDTLTCTSNEVRINVSAFTEELGISLPGVDESSVSWGDYDNDGDPDILLTGRNFSNYISKIYRNDQGVFTDINAVLTGVYNGSAAWGDYDNDGDLDILLTGSTINNDYISKIYRNDAGVFTEIVSGLTGVQGGSVAWGDYDNDGDLDILLTGYSDGNTNKANSKIYRNDSGVFTDIEAGLPGVYQSSVAWGDYDNDGDLDILLAGYGIINPVYILRIYRNDAGTFIDSNSGLTGLIWASVAWGDYDNDGDLDIVMKGGTAGNYLSVIYRNDAGIFKDINAGLTGVSEGSVAWGDCDNDGDLDILLTGHNGSDNISKIYRNDAGVFTDLNACLTGVQYGSVAWGDYDNDGDLDILLTGDPGNFNLVSKIYKNNINVANTVPATPSDLQSHVTGTGSTLSWNKSNDIQTVRNGLSYNVYIGTEEGSVNKRSPMAALSGGYRRIVQNGVIQGNSWNLKNPTPGTYYWSVQAIDNCFAGSAFATEEIFVIQFTLSVSPAAEQSLKINQNGTTLTVTESDTPVSRQWKYSTTSGGPYTQTITDVTGTMYTPGFSTYGTYFVVCESVYDTSVYTSNEIKINVSAFAEEMDISLPGVDESSVLWGDYDKDGDLDILMTGDSAVSGPGGISKIYRNDAGVFTDINAGLTGVKSSSVAWGDFDNDNDLDILLTGYKSGYGPISKIYRNDTGIFTDINAGLTGVEAGSVSWEDYDNDGDPDILLAGNNSSGNLGNSHIYRNDAGIFTDINAGLTGVKNCSVAWGDYDTDGDPDILLTGSVGLERISKIYRNDAGFFTGINADLIAVSQSSVAWGDYDHDGDPDILLSGETYNNGYVTKIYNNDAGVFTDIYAGLTGVRYGSVAWGDCDNDGDLDIILSGDAGGSYYVTKIYLNNAGVFTDIKAGLTGVCKSAVVWADYDNDGDLDILLTGKADSGFISKIFRNNVTIANTVPDAPSNLHSNLAGTGVQLIWNKANDAQTDRNGLSYNIYIGTETGTVNKRSPMASMPGGYRRIVRKGSIQDDSWNIKRLSAGTYYWSVQAIDNNYAGSAFATESSFVIPISCSVSPVTEQFLSINQVGTTLTVTESGTPASRQWKYSTVNGGPYDQPIMGATGTTYTPKFSTLGTYYIVCESTKDTINYISNQVTINIQAFKEQTGIHLTGVNQSSVAWGDYDNDGDLDILLTGSTGISDSHYLPNFSGIYKNDAGVFMDINAGLPAVQQSSLAWGDFDNDSDLDILLTGYSQSTGATSNIYRNNAGVFTDINAGLAKVQYSSVAWGDYDNDGDLDILLTGNNSYSGSCSKIYRNDEGVFTAVNAGLTIVDFSSVAWGDYDNDGDLDILLAGNKGSGSVSKIYRNDAGVFTDINAGLPGVDNSSVSWGDYDNDGDADILLTGKSDSSGLISKIYRNDNGIFTDINAGLTGVYYSSAAWGDYDNDGYLDILITGSTSTSKTQYSSIIYRNIGNNSFSEQSGMGLTGVGLGSSAWGDYDNDGDLDILLTGNTVSGYFSKIYRNNLNLPSTVPSTPSNLQSNVTGSDVSLTWNKSFDTQTTQDGLSYNLYIGTAAGTANKRSPMAAIPGGYRRIVQKGVIQDNSWTIKNLPGGTYYWSVQAIDNSYAGGEWAAENTFTLLSAPIAASATNITQNTFVANWNSSAGATAYYIDIATDSGFTTFVSGYNNLDVGNVTSKSITGLASNTCYYYRVRAGNHAGMSVCSGPVTVTTMQPLSVISDISGSGSLLIFPNPASTGFEIKLNCITNGKTMISLYNSAGIKIQEFQTDKMNPELNYKVPVAGLQNGIYSVKITVNDREISYSSIVIIK